MKRYRRADRMLRLRDVTYLAGLSNTTVYDLMAKGKFPRPAHIEPTIVRWSYREVMAWVHAKFEQRDRSLLAKGA